MVERQPHTGGEQNPVNAAPQPITVHEAQLASGGVVVNLTRDAKRQSRRELKEAEKRAGDLYRSRMTYGDDIGTDSHQEKETWSHPVRRLAELRADKRARSTHALTDEVVPNMAPGYKKPGKVTVPEPQLHFARPAQPLIQVNPKTVKPPKDTH